MIKPASESKHWKLAYPMLVMSLCAVFLFYKYVLQIFPSIITDQLMQEFKLNGQGLGNLVACFYYAYLVTQLFVGMLLDKYSARYLTSGAIFCCALGVYLFSSANNLIEASLFRAMMGVGVAFATVSYMKLTAVWFPPRQYALVSGLLATAAMSGAVFGQAPMAYLIKSLGWRHCLNIVGMVGLGFALLFLLCVPDRKTSPDPQTAPFTWQDLKAVFGNKQNWLLTLYSGLAFSPIAVFGGLWGNPFLEQAFSLTKTQAATYMSLVFIGLGLGSPFFGWISDYLGVRRNVMLFGTLLSAGAISLILYCNNLPTQLLALLLFTFGFGLGAFMIAFTIGKEINKLSLTATVIAMINSSDALLDALTEPFIGKLLDISWDGTIVNGAHHFSLASYHLALGVLPLFLLIASLLLCGVKDSKN